MLPSAPFLTGSFRRLRIKIREFWPLSSLAVNGRLMALRRSIWKRRPILGSILRRHGAAVLFDYTRDFIDVNPVPALEARRPELVAVASELIAERLGSGMAESVSRQLLKFPLVSTADHHGPIDHPFWVNANIITALPFFKHPDPDLKHIVVFSFASVSMNNASTYPRGILFHGGAEGEGDLMRLPILPDRLKMGVVYGTRSFTREDLYKAESQMARQEKAGLIGPRRRTRLCELLECCFGAKDVLAAPDFNTQITRINHHLWPRLFHVAHTDACLHHGSAQRMPGLVYVDIETLVTRLFLRHHVERPDSLVHRLLFDRRFMALMPKHFDGIPGAFSASSAWGTYLFWGIDEKGHRLRLRLKKDSLVSLDGRLNFAWTPEAIAAALREKKIFPGMMLCYLVVALYYGMKCLGGFCQVNDLTLTKHAWAALLREVGLKAEAEAFLNVQTKELGGDGMVLSYLRTQRGITPATGIDMALSPGSTTYENYVALSRRVTLDEMMAPMLPEMYTVLYASDERDAALSGLRPEAIIKKTGLARKLGL